MAIVPIKRTPKTPPTTPPTIAPTLLDAPVDGLEEVVAVAVLEALELVGEPVTSGRPGMRTSVRGTLS